MQVKLLQLLVELSQRQTRKEAASLHAEGAEKLIQQQSKSKRRWDKKGDRKQEAGGKKPKPTSTVTSNQASSSGAKGPSGLFKDGAAGSGPSTSKKSYN